MTLALALTMINSRFILIEIVVFLLFVEGVHGNVGGCGNGCGFVARVASQESHGTVHSRQISTETLSELSQVRLGLADRKLQHNRG